MLGRRKEQEGPRIYTPRDVVRLMRNFTSHDLLPPEELILRVTPRESLEIKSWEAIKEINRVNSIRRAELKLSQVASHTPASPVPVYEASRPLEKLRRGFAHAAIVFTAGLHR